MLLQARVDMAPWVDPRHQHPGVTGGIRHSLPGLDAVDPLFHVGVFGQLRALQVFGYNGGVDAKGGLLHPGALRIAALVARRAKNMDRHPAPIRIEFADLA